MEGVEQGAGYCLGQEGRGCYYLKDLRECPEEDNDREGGRRVVGGITRLVEDNAKCSLEGGGVETLGQQGVEDRGE